MSNYFPDALKNLCPNSEFLIVGDYALGNVQWVKLADPIPTQEQIEVEATNLAQIFGERTCKQRAKEKIAATDWAVLPDVGLANVTAFETYRAALRELIKNPVADPVWPTEPQPIWS